MSMSKKKPSEGELLQALAAKVLGVLGSGESRDQIILIIPSHDKDDKPISDQSMWASAAGELFAELYGGATAFKALAGTYKTDDGRILHDEPILIESYAERGHVDDPDRLGVLLEFAVRMGRQTKQECVALIVNDFIHYI